MFDKDRQLNALIVKRKGLVCRREAFAAGIPRHLIDDRVDAGLLLVVHEGVLRHAAVPVTTEQRWLAAVLGAGPDALLYGRAAAALRGWPDVRRVKPEVVSPHTDLPILHGVDVHRVVRIQPHERSMVRGIPVTSAGRTALDFARLVSFAHAQEVISAAVIMKLLTPLDIVLTLERSAGRGVPGTTKLRGVALTLDEIEGLESVLELDGYRAVSIARVPEPMKQFELVCADGREVRMDLAWPEFKVGLDWNGRRWHDTPARKQRTRERHESIEATDDWRHLQYGHVDVHDTPNDLRAEVESVINARRMRPAA
jgi:hypothetical protein